MILTKLQAQGIQILIYLDDYLIWADSKEACILARDKVLSILLSKGFIINLEKSRLSPQQIFKWLGLLRDTVHLTVSLPSEKKCFIRTKLDEYSRRRDITRRSLERIIGLLNFASIISPLLAVYTKVLKQHLPWSARPSHRDLHHQSPISLKGN